MRRAARVDSNHRRLLDLARQLGGFVIDCRSLGQGAPDAFVFRAVRTAYGGWHAVEIKTPRGKRTPAQVKLHAQVPVLIWRTEDDVLRHFGVGRRPVGGAA